MRDDPVAGATRSHEGRRDASLVEPIGSPFADCTQRVREILLHERLTRTPRSAVSLEKDRRRRAVLAKVFDALAQHVGIALFEDESAFSQRDRGRDQGRTRQRAVLLAHVFKTMHRAGNGDGQMPTDAEICDHIALLIEKHVGLRRERRSFPEVDKCFLPIGELNRHEAAAAEIAGRWIGHRERVTHRNGGVDRGSAALEHVDADLRREMLRGDDHAVFGCDGRGGSSLSRRLSAEADQRDE